MYIRVGSKGVDGGGGVLGVRRPPPLLLLGDPKHHKERHVVHVRVNMPHFST